MGLYSRDDLAGLRPRHDALIGVDSDGCVFDSMAVKQCRHFHPQIIRHWGLERIGDALRETAEFVNLGSVWRGRNRFAALLKTFELLEARADVRSSGVALPALAPIREYVESGVALGNPTLEEAATRTGNAELARLLAWSLDVNRSIASQPEPIPPFAGAREALARMAAVADTIVISQTPEAALVSEWRQHGIDRFIRIIAGQELGTKAEHITLASKGKYDPRRVLLLGDAPGDLEAAQEAGVSFFPIVPGREEECWKRFGDEALDRFLAGNYDSDYADGLVGTFLKALPAQPPW
jgi:phosphoglycolate phosphatase-like HAD superfamily hydrolase